LRNILPSFLRETNNYAGKAISDSPLADLAALAPADFAFTQNAAHGVDDNALSKTASRLHPKHRKPAELAGFRGSRRIPA
jgi:hypothetical protein